MNLMTRIMISVISGIFGLIVGFAIMALGNAYHTYVETKAREPLIQNCQDECLDSDLSWGEMSSCMRECRNAPTEILMREFSLCVSDGSSQ